MSWRPILGHERIVSQFAVAWRRSRLGHAYCFIGESGVGKHSFAVELAKTLLCERLGDSFEACDVCDSCRLVPVGTHPDLFQVARPADKLEFPIDVIRDELLPSMAMKPARGGRKIAIVDDADDLNTEAANCFLKTLEEPPPGSLLILVGGTNVERQLPTILSRCQVARFAPLPPDAVRKVLTGHGIADPARQQRLLQLAGGSPGRALALDDDEIWAFRQHLLDVLARPTLDPAQEAAGWMAFIGNAGKEASLHRQRANFVFRILLAILQSSLRLMQQPPASPIGEEVSYARIADRLGERKLLAWIERALQADIQVDRRVQLVLVVEAYLDAICRA